MYTTNHTVVTYSTRDFSAWTYLGPALPPASRSAGIEFRPHVIPAPDNASYIMW